MSEILSQLQTQLAEFKALKEQFGGGEAGLPDPASQIAVNIMAPTPESGRSGVNSSSSSHVGHLTPSASPER